MNKISFCNKEDINDLISFIDTHWKKDHIFVKNKELFNFQHKNDDQYNFVISRNQNNKINGILGFIPNYKFDSSLKKSSCVWLAIWKVDESIAEHGLGIVLLRWLEEKLNPDMIGTVGQNYNVNPLYKALGYETGELNHFFYINDEIKKFKIIKNVKSISVSTKNDKSLDFKKINIKDIPDNIFLNLPLKSKEYVKNRFLNHPIYKYLLFGIYLENNLKILVITRKVKANNQYCLRIVDMYGDFYTIKDFKLDLDSLVKDYKCEYVDCLNYGLPRKYFLTWGFNIKKDEVIPEYFEPFIQKNRSILYAYKTNNSNYFVFKADCDQDRPNI